MSDRIYCYTESDVLINKLNIRDLDRLSEAEGKITQLRLNDLIISPIHGNFNLKHLQGIHKYLCYTSRRAKGSDPFEKIIQGEMKS